ncbi:MAG TPA: hypothetical protein VJU58_13285, partial [Microbacterium sp.]|nr:hypothetical protein [Microbacterium sp.]
TEFRAVNAPVDLIHIVTTGGVYVVDVAGTEHVAALGQTIRPPTHTACRFLVPRGDFQVTTLPGAAVRDIAREAFVDAPVALDPDAIRPISPAMERLWQTMIGACQMVCVRGGSPYERNHTVGYRQGVA